MKRHGIFLAFLLVLLTACAAPTKVKNPLVTAVTATAKLPSVTFENFGASTYYGYVKVTVPFPNGTWKEGMTAVTEDGEPVDFLPLKYYLSNGDKSYVALAQAIFKAKLPPSGRRTIRLLAKDIAYPPFVFGDELAKYIATNTIPQHFMLSFTPPGGAPCYASIDGAWEFMQTSATRTVLRIHNHPICTGGRVNKDVSFTTYWELLSGQNHGNLYIVVGNDTLENPVNGGLQIGSVDVLIKPPFELGLFYPSGWGFPGVGKALGFQSFPILQNTSLSDGQTYVVKARWGVFGPSTQFERSSFLIDANNSPLLEQIGTADWSASSNSGAFGPTGDLPSPRGTQAQMRQATMSHCFQNTVAGASSYLGVVNLNPPQTGSQPAFFSGLAMSALQALHAQSICPVRSAMLAVYKESWRPSYYWWTPPGQTERRVDKADWPDFFMWSSRGNFFDWSWQQGKPNLQYWHMRIPPFQEGNRTGGWQPYDNQHFEFSPIRGVYEMTGDVYLGEIIKHNQNIEYWDYYTGRISNLGWFNHLEADRAFGRLGKEAAQSFEYFPETNLLKTALADKTRVVALPQVSNSLAQKGWPFLVDIPPDARVQLTTDCMNGMYVSQGVPATSADCHAVMAWQTPFFLELLSLQIKNGQGTAARTIGKIFMDHADKYIDTATGIPVTYFLVNNNSIRTYGGIGIWWWAGWLNLAKHYPNHPNQPLIAQLKAHIDASIASAPLVDQYWRGQDEWKSY